ncbi:hypothetical protein DLJ53_23880 [Acuticoccus sediminis]|uniref:Uncharacterized protein n=1 Tax=Acuticoccus sediminis TaxID=2184697 RepID=A0A8B2NTF6_9HYPH|nr:hypothetical protein DLJ53_23880 [Acuticoccus sediminis]
MFREIYDAFAALEDRIAFYCGGAEHFVLELSGGTCAPLLRASDDLEDGVAEFKALLDSYPHHLSTSAGAEA